MGSVLTVDYNMVTTLEANYLLKNHDGYMDGDKKCVIIKTRDVPVATNL